MENRIKELLAERNARYRPKDGNYLSLEELGRRAGLALATISRIANGKQWPNKHHQRAIAKALGRPLRDVFPTMDRRKVAV